MNDLRSVECLAARSGCAFATVVRLLTAITRQCKILGWVYIDANCAFARHARRRNYVFDSSLAKGCCNTGQPYLRLRVALPLCLLVRKIK